jgi:hypothetical protein
MKLFYGTTDIIASKVAKIGIWDWSNKQPAFLTDSFDEALSFALIQSNVSDDFKLAFPDAMLGKPAVVELDVPKDAVTIIEPLGIYAKKIIDPACIVSVSKPEGTVQSRLRRRSVFYPGWMGVMETAKFLQQADEEDIAQFKKLIDQGKIDAAWSLVEQYLGISYKSSAQSFLTLYAAVDRFTDPTMTGLKADETLSDSLSIASNHKGYQIAVMRVPKNLVEDVPGDAGSDVNFYTPVASVSPMFVRAVYNPWLRREFKITANSVSFSIDNILPLVRDKKELAAIKAVTLSHGEVSPLQQPIFIQRITPYLAELLRQSHQKYPMDSLFSFLRKGTFVQDGYGNYSLMKLGSEIDKTLTLSVGDIVKDINTKTQGEVIAISKMHHEADVDIVVRWETPINGQTIFEVHPNEIEFVRRKTDDEVLKDLDWRYYEESALESKGLMTRMDYGIREASGFFSPNEIVIDWDEYKPGLGLYRAVGHIDSADGRLFWAVDNDTSDGSLQIVDPEEIADNLIDFRTSLTAIYENAQEMIDDASGVITGVANERFKQTKISTPQSEYSQEQSEEKAPQKKAPEQKSTSRPVLPDGVPSESQPDLNGHLLNDDGSKCVPFYKAMAIFVQPLNRWQVMVFFREPTVKDPMTDEMFEVEDYMNRRSLCVKKPK